MVCFLSLSPCPLLLSLDSFLTYYLPISLFSFYHHWPQRVSNNQSNSTVIEKQLSFWIKMTHGLQKKKKMLMTAIVFPAVWVCVCVCYMCMYGYGSLPSSSSTVHGQCLIWPHMPSFSFLFFPHIYTQYQAVTENWWHTERERVKNVVPLKDVLFFVHFFLKLDIN